MMFNQSVEAIGRAVDVAGVLAIAGGIGLTILLAAGRVWRHEPDVYRSFRQLWIQDHPDRGNRQLGTATREIAFGPRTRTRVTIS